MNLFFLKKVFRFDLTEEDEISTYDSQSYLADNDARNSSYKNIVKVYQKAFKLLKKSLRKNKMTPCIVFNLRHSLIFTKDSTD